MQQLVISIGLVALSASWLLPGHYPPWASFQQEFLAVLGGLLIGWAAVNDRRLRVPVMAAVVMGAAVVPALQTAFGQIAFVSDGVLATAYLLGFGLCMVAGASLSGANRGGLLDGLSVAIVAAAIVSVGLALTQWLRLGELLWVADLRPGGRPYANIAQHNHIATLMLVAVAGLLRGYERRKLSGPTLALGTAWLGIGLVLCQSRSPWIFILALLMWVVFARSRVPLRLTPQAIVSAVGLYVAATAALPWINRAALLQELALSMVSRGGSDLRWIHWQSLVEGLTQSPWIGYGWSQVSLAQQAGAPAVRATGEWLTISHNLFLDLLIWNGVPIGLFLSGALCFWYVRHVVRCANADQWTLLLGITAVASHSLVEGPLTYAYFLVPMGLMMGALDGISEGAGRWSMPRLGYAVPLTALTALAAWIPVEYLEVEAASRQMRMVLAGIGTDKVSTAPPPAVVLLDAPRDLQKFVMIEATRDIGTDRLEWMRRVAARNPTPPVLLRYALAAGLNRRPDDARRALVVLCKTAKATSCDEANSAWLELRKRYPELKSIAVPLTEPTDL